ncbi:MAG: cupin domain-containing protein [Candidatus Hydrothermarchaeota archaeon]
MELKKLKEIEEFSPKAFVRKRIFETTNMHFNVYCIAPGQRNPLHGHPKTDEVLYFVEGEGEVLGGMDGKERLSAKAGDVVLWVENEPHAVINTGKENMICILAQAPLPVEHVPLGEKH